MSYDKEALKLELIRDEGKRLIPYQDSLGFWTVGIGHLLTGRELHSLVNVVSGKPRKSITEVECESLFLNDIQAAERNLDRLLPLWRNLDEVRQRGLLNLSFNLGSRLGQFKRFLVAMKLHDYESAADALIDSKWYQQVKTRAPRVVRMIRFG